MSRHYYQSAEDRKPPSSTILRDGEVFAWGQFNAAVSELSAEIDRLEDLRRWRPMTEAPDVPMRAPYVVLRGTDANGSWDPQMGIVDGFWAGGKWYFSEGDRITAGELPRYQWAYIPGQEPEVKP